ncbi:methylated-DNA--[protein]-cysteine S-methyltransferase [Polaribacter gangjinensis]|uniref:methylated-DNA--[protein]-cysteine S-methyltransferase n=1 Tax=Polaribacter gangjinensis TaxID=574710 RepID=UPI001B80ABBF|nr:methylated-DNA--[protein]-cysteine S-methyltransferase [Polaribacter gangjinensis]
MTIETAFLETPIGTVKITGDENGIQTISIIDEKVDELKKTPECLQDCVNQLTEYFGGKRASFNLTINPKGTAFQIKVWKSLLQIPYGKTTSYLEQSSLLGDKKAIRAVASANGKNPILIVIPCHRVLGSDGSLTGFSAGLWRKKWLLAHENPVKQESLF